MLPIQTYVPNQQVLAAELNAIQARAVGAVPGDSNNAHTTLGAGNDIIVWMDALDLASAALVKVDASRDFRDRILVVNYVPSATANQLPGQASDSKFDYIPKPRIGYTGRGAKNGANTAAPSAGDPPVVLDGVSWALQIDTSVWLYAHPTDGSLWLYNATASTIRTPILDVRTTAATGKRP